jgi:hypothetical protein
MELSLIYESMNYLRWERGSHWLPHLLTQFYCLLCYAVFRQIDDVITFEQHRIDNPPYDRNVGEFGNQESIWERLFQHLNKPERTRHETGKLRKPLILLPKHVE